MSEKKPRWGMEHEELVEFFKEVVESVSLMSRRQRWEFRRDLKTFCRLANERWPYGKEFLKAPEGVHVSDESRKPGGVLSAVQGEGSGDGGTKAQDHGRDVSGETSVANRAGSSAEASEGQTSGGNNEETGC